LGVSVDIGKRDPSKNHLGVGARKKAIRRGRREKCERGGGRGGARKLMKLRTWTQRGAATGGFGGAGRWIHVGCFPEPWGELVW